MQTLFSSRPSDSQISIPNDTNSMLIAQNPEATTFEGLSLAALRDGKALRAEGNKDELRSAFRDLREHIEPLAGVSARTVQTCLSTIEQLVFTRLASNDALVEALRRLEQHAHLSAGAIPKPLTEFTNRLRLGTIVFPPYDEIKDEVTASPESLRRFVAQTWDESGLKILRKSFSFSDLELEAGYSAGSYHGSPSREGVDVSTRYAWNRETGMALVSKIPFVPANMRTVADIAAAQAFIENGGVPIVRWINSDAGRAERMQAAEVLGAEAFVTVRSSPKETELALEILRRGAGGVCLEMANAFSPAAFHAIRTIKAAYPDRFLVVGNIVTPAGYLYAALAGADMVKVGRGSGAACTTPRETGMGARQLSACLNIALAQAYLLVMSGGKLDVPFCSDGGISNSGDVVKAAFAGAESVMMGSIFAAVEESPAAKYEGPDGRHYALYLGEASFDAAQADGRGTRSVKPQGEAGLIPVRGSMKQVIAEFRQGLQAGIADGDGMESLIEFVRQPAKLQFQEMAPAATKESNTRFAAQKGQSGWREITPYR